MLTIGRIMHERATSFQWFHLEHVIVPSPYPTIHPHEDYTANSSAYGQRNLMTVPDTDASLKLPKAHDYQGKFMIVCKPKYSGECAHTRAFWKWQKIPIREIDIFPG